MIIEYFDVNKIIGVKHVYMREDTSYSYYLDQPEERNFFGFVTRPARPKGFAEDRYSVRVKEEQLISWGRVITAGKVWYPSQVTVYLLDDCQVTKKFRSDPDAIEWIKRILSQSQGKFEVVTHK